MKPKPILRLLPLICFMLLSQAAFAAPARRGIINLRQPDGTVIQATLSGDEHGHLTTTLDGCALVQDAEGWWCYARYDYYGHLLNTGEHVGAPDTPGEIIAASRNIPYDLLRRNRNNRIRQIAPLRSREIARTRSAAKGAGSRIRHGLIILAQFQNLEFRFGKDKFEELINGEASTSALNYFKDQWKDIYSFKFDISDIVTLPHDYAYYGANNDQGQDGKPDEMIRDACKAVSAFINFSDYDNDGDGIVDNVFVFYAGPNESEGAGDNYIWPHQWSLQEAGITYRADGVLVDIYACTSELSTDRHSSVTSFASIGTFCHEYTHTFGIPDLYDTDDGGSGGYSEAMWSCIDLMDAGNYNDNGRTPPGYSVLERWHFGMSEGTKLTKGKHTLRPISENGDYYYMTTDEDKEIFLIECRNARGWDAHIGGSGLLIYHIDQSDRPAGESSSVGNEVSASDRWDMNELNARPDQQCADLIEPDPDARKKYQSVAPNSDAIRALASHAFWPYGDVSIFTCDTDPAFKFWSGADSPLGISDIQLNADGSVSFFVFDGLAEKAPAVKIDKQTVFQDATIIQWSSVDPSFNGNSIIRYGLVDAPRLTEVEVSPYTRGKYAFVIEGLKPTTAYKVQLFCRKDGIPGPVNSNACFTTKSDKKADSYPYIYLKDVERGSGGTFAPNAPLSLRVYNAPDADGVKWYFEGKPITPEADGYYHISRSGQLKAVISYPGSTDIITKKIIVK